MTAPENFDHELSEATSAFVAGLGARLDAIALVLDANDTTTARALAHALHGTAGSYGLHAVSEAAAALEDALAQGTTEFRPLLTRLREAASLP